MILDFLLWGEPIANPEQVASHGMPQGMLPPDLRIRLLVLAQESRFKSEGAVTEQTPCILAARRIMLVRSSNLSFVRTSHDSHARLSCGIALLLFVPAGARAQQFADPEFDSKVDRPAFTDRHPVVYVDAAHNNFHTADGRYKPFAELLNNDGFSVASNNKKFTTEALKGCDPRGFERSGIAGDETAGSSKPRVRADRVRCRPRLDSGRGIAPLDRRPSSLWNVERDSGHQAGCGNGQEHDARPDQRGTRIPGTVEFLRLNKLLGDHPILTGRDGSERIDRVVTFTGQSLKGPEGSVMLLKLAPSAFDQSRPNIPGRNAPARGRAQGLAFTLGRGKVVVLGEAAMLSAGQWQSARPDGDERAGDG